jgi:hypothetical protein
VNITVAEGKSRSTQQSNDGARDGRRGAGKASHFGQIARPLNVNPLINEQGRTLRNFGIFLTMVHKSVELEVAASTIS